MPDGSVTEQKWEVRKGTFENSPTSVKMHWTDSTAPGDAEWIAQIKHRNILLNVGGVLMEYHYVPPGIELDL
jgi:ribulose kinase